MKFDTYIFIDWSAYSNPTAVKPEDTALWMGELETGSTDPVTHYFRTRQSAHQHLRARLTKLVSQKKRVLLGFDFPYGYPAGTATALGLTEGKPWSAIWELLGQKILLLRDRTHFLGQMRNLP